MKDFRKYQYLIILFLIAALTVVVLNYFVEGITIEEWLIDLAYVILGFTVSLEVVFIGSHQDTKKLNLLENYVRLWNGISYRVKGAGEHAFNEIPLGIIVFNHQLDVEWANKYAKEIFINRLLNRNLRSIDRDLAALIISKTPVFAKTLYGKIYRCELHTESQILYLTDITTQVEITTRYEKRLLALGVVNLDNFELAMGSLDAQERSQHISNLIGIFSNWSEKYHISLKGFSDERYLIIMDNETIDHLIQDNFSILDEVKEYCTKENLRLSASIGIAIKDVDAISLMKLADTQLELALNRGGNQVVVLRNNEVLYFGAKSESYETRTPVAIRLKAEELRDLILSSEKVIIMAHKEMDADAYGACVAARAIATSMNKETHIVFDETSMDISIVNIYESIKKEHQNYLPVFYTVREALDAMDDKTLLIIVDCQYSYLLLDERLYKKAKRVAIIDHHRRNSQAIKSYDYLYIQPSSSSSVELIVELVDYITPYQVEISEVEATWLLMGIMVDTNNFLYRTSSRTFQVLAKLQTYGAQMLKVQRYLREDLGDYMKRNQILNNIEIIDGNYGIATCDDHIYLRSFIAKIAEDVISVNNIKMAFCLGKISEDTIGISARSFDEANAQMIMERLGGGGHFNNAAAQIKNVTIETAKNLLKQALKDSIAEGDQSMKIILTQTVKGKGKANDIIDVPAGHANFLIRSNQAIEATADNIKNLEYGKMMEKRQQELHLQEMKELKLKVDASPITVSVRVGKNGKLFGTVSTKQIVDEYKLQYNTELDKRKIIMDKEIDALGTYKIPIQLHKEVTALITLYVVEME
ncbi:MAG: 50S ribosomal protein L9 [Bacilli bacterium]|nr:50S ribosomal protein L9 [Bacilli bacterium]